MVLFAAYIRSTMDGRGCFFDNIFIERLWRSVKQECIYLQSFETIEEISLALEDYFRYYNNVSVRRNTLRTFK